MWSRILKHVAEIFKRTRSQAWKTDLEWKWRSTRSTQTLLTLPWVRLPKDLPDNTGVDHRRGFRIKVGHIWQKGGVIVKVRWCCLFHRSSVNYYPATSVFHQHLFIFSSLYLSPGWKHDTFTLEIDWETAANEKQGTCLYKDCVWDDILINGRVNIHRFGLTASVIHERVLLPVISVTPGSEARCSKAAGNCFIWTSLGFLVIPQDRRVLGCPWLW